MNAAQIKETYTCLDWLGDPVRSGSWGYLYACPWREDKHPSLTVSPNGKGWQDKATGDHGNVIDLAMRCLGTTDLKTVCAAFEGLEAPSSFPQSKILDQSKTLDGGKEEGGFARFEVMPIQSRGLYHYLDERHIDHQIARQTCFEAHYSFDPSRDDYLYALAFPNDLGGYELRSVKHKGSKAPKGISTIEDGQRAWIVFEGCFDMMAFATMCHGIRHNYLVLNSTVNVPAAISRLSSVQEPIYLALDNDDAGTEATQHLLDALKTASDIRSRFLPAKDVADYLVTSQKL